MANSFLFHHKEIEIPSVVEELAENGRVNCLDDNDDQENKMLNPSTRAAVNAALIADEAQRDKAKEANYKEAWRFYGKMLSHFWAYILYVVVFVSCFIFCVFSFVGVYTHRH